MYTYEPSFKMKILTPEEIEKYASRKNVRRIAVENFLMSMGNDYEVAQANLYRDAQMYNWNKATIKAIDDGQKYACKMYRKRA